MSPKLVSVTDVAALLGCSEEAALQKLAHIGAVPVQKYYSFRELAERWRVSRPQVYCILRKTNAHVLDFGERGCKSRKIVPLETVLEIESKRLKIMR